LDSTGTELQHEAFTVIDEEGRKYLHHDGPLTLTYHTAWSRLFFQQDSVPFEPSGYHDPRTITWQGQMGKRRIGDWLPYDYLAE
jgi:hypothetical protein